MNDPSPIERLSAPLVEEIQESLAWAQTVSTTTDFELFLNPADAEGLLGCKLWGMPVRQSLGVPVGAALIYDVKRTRYIRRSEQPRETP
jgi:hypothetical protein